MILPFELGSRRFHFLLSGCILAILLDIFWRFLP